MNRNEIIKTAKDLDTIVHNLEKTFCHLYTNRTCNECPFNDDKDYMKRCKLDHINDIIHNLKYKNY